MGTKLGLCFELWGFLQAKLNTLQDIKK